MVQAVNSVLILLGEKKVVLEKPHILHRIFFSLRVLARLETWVDMKISFGDPLFLSHYRLNGPEKYFEATGPDIFQGDVWAFNNSDTNYWLMTTEILH